MRIVAEEGHFLKTTEENFTLYYQSLIPWVNRLRGVVFPNDKRRGKEDPKLYSWMKGIYQAAEKDQKVSEW
jgi:hypothetical protein